MPLQKCSPKQNNRMPKQYRKSPLPPTDLPCPKKESGTKPVRKGDSRYKHLNALNVQIWKDDPTRGHWVAAIDAENAIKKLIASMIKTAAKLS